MPYLVIRGDKSLDEIPLALKNAGRKVREITVYETSEHPELEQRIFQIFNNLGRSYSGMLWFAFFSPSSAGMVLPYLQSSGFLRKPSSEMRIAAIGETTKRFIEDEGLVVHAVAEGPNAASLVQAIENYMIAASIQD